MYFANHLIPLHHVELVHNHQLVHALGKMCTPVKLGLKVSSIAGQQVPGANGQPRMEQAGGCGGFGKGNFTALFKSIEVRPVLSAAPCDALGPHVVIGCGR